MQKDRLDPPDSLDCTTLSIIATQTLETTEDISKGSDSLLFK